jgi:hypothetical protein
MIPAGRFRFTYIHNCHVNVRDFYQLLVTTNDTELREFPPFGSPFRGWPKKSNWSRNCDCHDAGIAGIDFHPCCHKSL